MLLFDKYMKKSVLWNYNHTDTNMTKISSYYEYFTKKSILYSYN